jgi:DNA-binding response OmpR family regulator
MRLLMVEDDPLVARAAAGWLRPAEIVVEATVAGARLRQHERFRGYVIDQHLPDGRGLSLAIETRARSIPRAASECCWSPC